MKLRHHGVKDRETLKTTFYFLFAVPAKADIVTFKIDCWPCLQAPAVHAEYYSTKDILAQVSEFAGDEFLFHNDCTCNLQSV